MVTSIAIQYYSFLCTQLNGFKYSYLTQIILFNINHLFAQSEMVSPLLTLIALLAHS